MGNNLSVRADADAHVTEVRLEHLRAPSTEPLRAPQNPALTLEVRRPERYMLALQPFFSFTGAVPKPQSLSVEELDELKSEVVSEIVTKLAGEV